MTEQQQRFNAGKPKHSYFFASNTALKVLDDALGANNHADLALEDYSDALHAISAYLDGDDYALQDAATGLMLGLQIDSDGEVAYTANLGMCAAEFLAHVPASLEAYAAVCEYGEAKYERGNYRKGAPVTQYLDSALRHLLSRLRGERLDPESGKPHGGHALWNVIQAMEQPEFRDDRLPPVKQTPDPEPLPARDQSDGVECTTCHDDATLCPCGPCPEPETFDVVEAERRMGLGRTVEAVSGSEFVSGNQVRYAPGTESFEFRASPSKHWSESSFPFAYEPCRFVEVM